MPTRGLPNVVAMKSDDFIPHKRGETQMEEETFLNVSFDDVYDPITVPAGTEAQLRIIDAEIKVSAKTGGPFLQVRFDVPGEPTSKDIQHVMMLPTAQDDMKKQNARKLALRTFLLAFGLPTDRPVPPSEMVGATGWGILDEEESKEYGKQNRVRRFITGA